MAAPIFPLDDYRGTLHVISRPDGGSRVTWSAEYRVAAEIRGPVAGALRDVFAVALDGPERALDSHGPR